MTSTNMGGTPGVLILSSPAVVNGARIRSANSLLQSIMMEYRLISCTMYQKFGYSMLPRKVSWGSTGLEDDVGEVLSHCVANGQ